MNILPGAIAGVWFCSVMLLCVGPVNADDSVDVLAQEIEQLEQQRSVIHQRLTDIDRQITRKRGALTELLNALESLNRKEISSVPVAGAVSVAAATANGLVSTAPKEGLEKSFCAKYLSLGVGSIHCIRKIKSFK